MRWFVASDIWISQGGLPAQVHRWEAQTLRVVKNRSGYNRDSGEGLVFRFYAFAELDRQQEMRFEWRRVGSKEDGEGEGWLLVMVRVVPSGLVSKGEGEEVKEKEGVGETGRQSLQDKEEDGNDGDGEEEEEETETEELVMLKWPATRQNEKSRGFELELKGSARSGVLGGRFTLMVVMTALKIYLLRGAGK